jgi:hypothetical protein
VDRRYWLALLITAASATYGSASTRPVPTPAWFDNALDEVCEKASYIVVGTVVDTTNVPGEGIVPIWTEYQLEVDTFITGEPTPDSTLVFRAAGGKIGHRGLIIPGSFRPSPGNRYLLYLVPCYSGLRLKFDSLMGQVASGLVSTQWPDSTMLLEDIVAVIVQKLEIRSPLWQRDNCNLVIKGEVLDTNLTTPNGDYNWSTGTFRLLADSILVNDAEQPLVTGDTLTIQVLSTSLTIPTLVRGEMAMFFLNGDSPDSLQLAPSMWSKWTQDGANAAVDGRDECDGTPTRLQTASWNATVAKISQ